MTIVSVAYPLLPVSADSAGGAEQILSLVDRAVVAAGHESLVIAAAGSRVAGELIETPASDGEITDAVRAEAQDVHRSLLETVLQSRNVDVIHFHGLDFHQYVPRNNDRACMLTTLHLPVSWYPEHIFRMQGITFNCVSASQSQTSPNRNVVVVHNGIELESYRHAATQRREHLLQIGRVCPEKGVDIALKVAQRLDMPLVVAGPVHPFRDHQKYFHEEVQPLLNHKRTHVGPVGLQEKVELLQGARCVLIPSLAPETSSLIAMEACAAGVPVVAFRSGALPEIVENGKTGFIVDSEDEMAEAVLRCASISPEVCRRTAERRFDCRTMTASYLRLYAEMLGHRDRERPMSFA